MFHFSLKIFSLIYLSYCRLFCIFVLGNSSKHFKIEQMNNKDDSRLIRSTSKALERVQVKLMRNFLFPRRSDERIQYFTHKYNLIQFV